ncbi:MAG: tautomerase family protein [Spirochaetales bacterium]|nr:tautomerase family protein [Spirochaetales bacterium]
MPSIIMEAGTVSKENKVELIKRLTATAAEITSIPESSFTVLIKENPRENWGMGGVPLDEIMKKMNH